VSKPQKGRKKSATPAEPPIRSAERDVVSQPLAFLRRLTRAGSRQSGEADPSAIRKFRFLSWFCTLHFVMFAWIFFRAPDMSTAGSVITRISGIPAAILEFLSGGGARFEKAVNAVGAAAAESSVSLATRIDALAPNITSMVGCILLLGFALHFVPERWFQACRQFYVQLPAVLQACCLLAFMFLFYKTATAAVVPFIYFQF
jgi:hypothetical protein